MKCCNTLAVLSVVILCLEIILAFLFISKFLHYSFINYIATTFTYSFAKLH